MQSVGDLPSFSSISGLFVCRVAKHQNKINSMTYRFMYFHAPVEAVEVTPNNFKLFSFFLYNDRIVFPPGNVSQKIMISKNDSETMNFSHKTMRCHGNLYPSVSSNKTEHCRHFNLLDTECFTILSDGLKKYFSPSWFYRMNIKRPSVLRNSLLSLSYI